MYETDYEFTYEYNNESYTYDLDEMCEYAIRDTHTQYNMYDVYEMDDEYARDSCDYNELAYRHYAWYNTHTSHEIHMYAHKRIVSVTLDIECYDDLELENLDWREVLDLQGDEKVDVSIRETADIY